MNLFKLSFVAVLLGSTALAQPVFDLEAGASYFSFHREKFEPSPRPTSVKQDSPVAPFVALGYSFSETFGLRLSYHYVSDVGAEVVFPSAPSRSGAPSAQVVTHARYSDDLHVVGLAPELRWVLSPTLRIVFSPALNWVTSRGDVRYAWGTPLVYPAQPQVRHRDDGLTLGGGIGVDWTVAPDWALSLSYHYTDLDPSFGRQANVFSGGLKWSF